MIITKSEDRISGREVESRPRTSRWLCPHKPSQRRPATLWVGALFKDTSAAPQGFAGFSIRRIRRRS
jgi:hypothetical protein